MVQLHSFGRRQAQKGNQRTFTARARIRASLLESDRRGARIGIEAPDDVKIQREELISDTAAQNRKARHEYEILDRFEAGIVLLGPEVKSLREGRANLADAYADIERGEVWLRKLHISPYEQANRENADPTRPRKLLLHRSEIARLTGVML